MGQSRNILLSSIVVRIVTGKVKKKERYFIKVNEYYVMKIVFFMENSKVWRYSIISDVTVYVTVLMN